jgi:methylamine dehydrogenase accessory protein MauD
MEGAGLPGLIVLATRTVVGLVLALAGVSKVFRSRGDLRSAIQAYGFRAPAARVMAALLPPTELATAGALLAGLFMPVPAVAATCLFVSFAATMSTALLRGSRVPCACFGFGKGEVSWRKVISDVFLALAAFLASGYAWQVRWSWPIDLVPGNAVFRAQGAVSELLLFSYAALWLITMVLIVGVGAMIRQIGLINRRIPPVGSRMGTAGPDVNELAPDLHHTDVLGRRVSLGKERERRTLLIFLSPRCRVCEDVAPGIRSLARSERATTDVVLVSESPPESLRMFVDRLGLTSIPAVASVGILQEYAVWTTPYAVLVNEQGLVTTKGVVNDIEDLESIVRAGELGVDSLETYLEVDPGPHQGSGLSR